MKKYVITFLVFLVFWNAKGQNKFPDSGNVEIYQGTTSYRAYDVINKNGVTVSRFEATNDATGQLWLKDASGNYKVAIRSHTTAPSAIAGEFVIGEFTMTSKNRQLYVNGTSEITGKLYGGSDFEIHQAGSGFRAYDVVNKNGITVSRFEATNDATGQLWLRDASGNYRVAIRANTTYPSAVAGELVVGEYTTISKGKKFFVNGDSWMSGQLTVDGTVFAEEIRVENVPQSDYVFGPHYNLRPLTEVENYIKENQHLPDFPSAKEFKENGVGLGEMDNMLLRKIEELTLYLIEQNKNNERLLGKIEELENRCKVRDKENEELKKELSNLKTVIGYE